MFLKNRNISSKIKRSKVTDYAALIKYVNCVFIEVLLKYVNCVFIEVLLKYVNCVLSRFY